MRSKKTLYLILLLLILTGCKEKTFTVTFDTLGGSLIDSINLNEGDTLDEIIVPKKEGYLFVSWLKDGIEYNIKNPITEDITLTANWIERPEIFDYYTVTFIIDENTEKTTVKENELVTELKAPTKENYTFVGWYSGEEKFDFNTKITKDITLMAKYELNIATVTYELDGGFGLSLETVPKNTILSIPETPVKIGYRFLKWTLDGKEFSFDTKITHDITLKAEWQQIEYVTITYETDGGNTISSQIIEKYTKINKLPTPNKEGYNFIEWQLNNETFNPDTTIENNITLKAIYETINQTSLTEGE